jgi:hypothetical protein
MIRWNGSILGRKVGLSIMYVDVMKKSFWIRLDVVLLKSVFDLTIRLRTAICIYQTADRQRPPMFWKDKINSR